MTRLHKGLIVMAIQLAVLGAVGAKFVADRANYPRVWLETAPIDPDLPIRGRYVRLNAVVESSTAGSQTDMYRRVRLETRDSRLVTIDAVDQSEGTHFIRWQRCGGERYCWTLDTPLAYFIPEHVKDPSLRAPGETLWVEASIPPKGAPRPIRLGVKKDGALRVLELEKSGN